MSVTPYLLSLTMLRNQRKKVKIAGAGPSGLTAAICLAKAGYDVQIYEARETVGARFIGDFQVLENSSGHPDPLEMLQKLGVSINFFARPIREATLFDYRLQPQTVSSLNPFGYFIQRGQREDSRDNKRLPLDEGLLRQALDAGVAIQYQTKRKPNDVDIIATGPSVADAIAKEMTFLTDSPDTVWVLFDMKYAPGGYVYLFVLDGCATFGCAITRDLSQINRYFDAALGRIQAIAPFTIRDKKMGYSFMDFRLKSSSVYDQRLYVGEAGGFQDYLFGLGLRYAFMTGHYAATSFIAGEGYDPARGAASCAGYDPLWKKSLLPSQEISLVNRSLYEWGGNWGLSYFVRQAGKSDFQHYLASWQATSLWKRGLLPIIQWAWKEKKPCRHPLLPHWCRERRQRPSQKAAPLSGSYPLPTERASIETSYQTSHRGVSTVKEAYRYCRDVTHRGGPHFSVGFRFLPTAKRNAIYAVYAFCRYADDLVDESQDTSPESLLKAWEEELHRCYRQEPTHPIGIALSDALLRYPIPIAGFLGLIAGCQMDLSSCRYPTFEALKVYYDRVATTIRDLALPVFGYSDPRAFAYGEALSTALQLTNIVRDIREDLDRGRIYLPLDEIQTCGYSEQELIERVKNTAFIRLIQFQCQRIRDLFRKSLPLVPLIDPDARFTLVLMREVYIALVDQMEQRPFDLLDRQIRLSWIQRGGVVMKQLLK